MAIAGILYNIFDFYQHQQKVIDEKASLLEYLGKLNKEKIDEYRDKIVKFADITADQVDNFYEKEKFRRDSFDHFEKFTKERILKRREFCLQKTPSQKPPKIVFLRVHKAGSLSMLTFLQKYARKHNYKNTLTKDGPQIGGFPNKFNATLHQYDDPTDIISEHYSYDIEEVDKVLSEPKNHLRIAIVRNPYDIVFSGFNYFYNKPIFKNAKTARARNFSIASCVQAPYFDIMGEPLHKDKISLSQFIDQVMEEKSVNKKNILDVNQSKFPRVFRANNSISYDFGHMNPNQLFAHFD